jgi:hypothetical protein
MATTFRQFTTGSSSIAVEVQDLGGSLANPGDLVSLVQPIRDVVALVATQFGQMPQEARPSELQITFGLKGLSNGQIAISLGDSTNLQIQLTWNGKGGSPVADLIGGALS